MVIVIRTLVTSLVLGYSQHRVVTAPGAPQKTAGNLGNEKTGAMPRLSCALN
jgi:hypothetical protein